MSMLLNQAPRFSSGPALVRHYKAVRRRMANLAPPPLIALPSPEMMAKGNLLPFVMARPEPAPAEKPKVFDTGEMARVDDIIPDQRGEQFKDIVQLSDDIKRVAIRRAIMAYFAEFRTGADPRRLLIIKRVTAAAFKVDIVGMTDRTNYWGIAHIRQIAITLARRLTNTSTPKIGRAFGGRDHTTIIHASKKYRALVEDVMTEMYGGGSNLIGDAKS